MSIQKCQRCGRQEHVPTHQYVKFDEKLHDLCASCWHAFREWFHAAERPEEVHTTAA